MNVPVPRGRRRLRQPTGFTLIELLVVITIIGILTSLVLGGLSQARSTARVAKTKSTIAKVDTLVQEHYRSYETRRVTIYETTSGSPVRLNPRFLRSAMNRPVDTRAAAEIRLGAIRDLMRMEMPERWHDIWDGNASPGQAPPTPINVIVDGQLRTFAVDRPSLANAYWRRYFQTPPGGAYDSAECLYLWVTTAIPESRERFRNSEVGDADEDGWPEFHDGWGNPIAFLRWAPGFPDSEIQAVVSPDPTDPKQNNIRRRAASLADHDPFDLHQVDIVLEINLGNSAMPPRGGWRLVPLVYSAGPDGIYGLSLGGLYTYQGNPFYYEDPPGSNTYQVVDVGKPVTGPNESVVGPATGNGLEDYLDNIHNHRIEAN